MTIDSEYNQRTDESYEEWKERILSGIVLGEVKMDYISACIMLDMPWDAAAAEALGKSYVEKRNQKEARKEEVRSELSDKELWSVLNEKQESLFMEKVRYQDQKRENARILRHIARRDHLVDEIVKAVNKNTGNVSIFENISPVKTNDTDANEGVLLLSDWHKGQVSANHWNVFNDTVFKKRITKLISETEAYADVHNVKKLHLFVLGDLINGAIHVSTRINNEENVIEQTTEVAEILSQMLMYFGKKYRVEVYFSRGNHDRVTANKKESIDAESFFDLLQYCVTARTFGHPNVNINKNEIDPEIIKADVAGHICFGVHGHKDKPAKVAEKLSTMTKIFPEYIFEGHFHSAAELETNGIEVIVNSSLCGTDDFAVSLRRNSRPSQKFMVFNKDGRLCTYNIDLTIK